MTATGGAAFPFSAVLGQEEVKLALLLNAIDPRIGGVLLRGEKGSAKSTLARGLAALLPGQAPFVELPVGATEDRVVGTLDLEAALTEGRRRLQPGLLAAAHGGVLYVDEVNLLPDHLVDVLLDVAASGVNRIEREGVSEAHPARFVLIGSMNPEEGELRPQLLDRFGLSVEVAATRDPTERAEAVGRRLAFDADPDRFVSAWRPAQVELAARVGVARPAPIGDELVATIARLCSQVGAEGLRADLVICRAAAALAGWEGRDAPGLDDVEQVALLALAHRRRRSPFEEPGIDPDELSRELDRAALGERGDDRGERGDDRGGGGDDRGESPANAHRREEISSGESQGETEGETACEPQCEPQGKPQGEKDGPPGGASEVRHDRTREPGEGEAVVAAATTRVIRLVAGHVTTGDAPSGRRSLAHGQRGRLVGDRSPQGTVGDLAVAATVRAVARRRALAAPAEPETLVMPGDLREAVREQRTA
ncbi:MAG: ATP-binding protein, partial [Acidimicrobiales bacterium]